jgi:hypothetical protein
VDVSRAQCGGCTVNNRVAFGKWRVKLSYIQEQATIAVDVEAPNAQAVVDLVSTPRPHTHKHTPHTQWLLLLMQSDKTLVDALPP